MLSRYNLSLPLDRADGTRILANGLTGAVDLCPAKIADILAEGDEAALPPEAREQLFLRGYLLDEGTNEDEKLDTLGALLRALSGRYLSLVVIPSYNCNFRCVYCFERNLQKHEEKRLNTVMSERQIEAIFRCVDKRPKGEKVTLTFMGGEPLLPANRPAIESIGENALERGLEIELCVTNGYYIDEYIDLLKKFGVRSLEVSLDGPKETHDARRFLANGEGTFERIARNVSAALESGLRIELRANVSGDTVCQFEALRKEARRRGWYEYPNFTLDLAAVQFCEGVDEAAKGYAAVPGEELDGFSRQRSALRNAFEKRDFYPLKPYYCGAHGNCVAVDCYGDLYACWGNALGDPKQSIGRLDVGNGEFAFDGRRQAWLDLRPDRRAECRACPYVFLCGGDCPMDMMNGHKCGEEKRFIISHITALGREMCAGHAPKTLKPLTRSYQEVFNLLSEPELARVRSGAVPAKIKWLF